MKSFAYKMQINKFVGADVTCSEEQQMRAELVKTEIFRDGTECSETEDDESICDEKPTDKQNNNANSLKDSHKFPTDEEPNILGHGNVLRQDNDSASVEDEKKCSCKMILAYDEAPNHLKFNPYIRNGYRTFLPTMLCLQSIFWWTNETINIWSHLIGFFIFLRIAINDMDFLFTHANFMDGLLLGSLMFCFCACLLLSAIYHIFSCKSEQHYDLFLSVDILGIALSLVAIYITGMHYAFFCFEMLRWTYSALILSMFGVVMALQVPKLNVPANIRMLALIVWAAFGIVPLFHWTYLMGGLQNAVVQLIVPRVLIMYGICALAYVFYAAKIPERWLTGKVDFFGHSHNWWHMIIVVAFYHWRNTGMVYAQFRLNNGCTADAIYQ